MRGPRWTRTIAVAAPVVLAAVIAVLVVPIVGKGDTHGVNEAAAGSLQRFLIAAGSGDGDTACGYLSIPETHRVERAAGPHVACSQAFFDSALDLGGRNRLDDLAPVHFSTTRQGRGALVTASVGKSRVRFTLAPASVQAIQQQPYTPPASNWRVTSGAVALVRPVP